MKFIQIILTVVITAAIVYYGLNLLSPHHSEAGAEPAGQTPGATMTPGGGGLTEDQARAIGHQVGERAASEVVKSMGNSSGGTLLTEDQVRSIARDEAEKVVADAMARQASTSTESAQGSQNKPSHRRPVHDENDSLPPYETPEAASSAKMQPRPTPPPRIIPHPKPAEHPRASAGHASTVQKRGPAHHAAAKAAPVTASKAATASPPSANVLTTWWTPSTQVGVGQFALVYAGSAAFDKAIVLLFSNAVSDPTGVARPIQVKDAKGNIVPGTWRISAQNPRMLIFNVPEGRYDLTLDKSMTDAQGRNLGRTLHGPVYVH